jgi:RimJ/RimL family protein N-acetyltransferase
VIPTSFTDGRLTIRPLRVSDLDADLEAKDDEQIDWLWDQGHREAWEAMTSDEQREHAKRSLQRAHDSFGPGPKWIFAVDTATDDYVAYVDCDLANDKVPAGQANISYSAHPSHRGHGYVSGAVRIAVRFLAEHTDAREVHILVDAENAPSLRVARAVGATPVERWTNERGRTMIRHVLLVPRVVVPPAE